MTEKSFSEILETLLGGKAPAPARPHARSHSQSLDQTYVFDWTRVHLQTKVSAPRPVKSPYPRRRRPQGASPSRPMPESVATAPVTPVEPPLETSKRFGFHQMTADGQAAFRLWQGLGSLLSKDNLNLKILKKEYRRLAKACHPDTHSGSAQRFRELKASHVRIERALQELELK